MEDDFVGAIKIKDGLFIGDEYAAQDFEFVVTNKVTHIINCAGKQIPNYWETVGVAYLTYDWMDSENQIVFDNKGEVVNEIFAFIEDAVKLGEGVLVHSLKGQSRSCCVLTAYFMKRYRWSLYKTLEFLTSRRSDLEIRTSFYHQLLNLESRLFQQVEGHVTVNWFEVGQENDGEELLLRNTFLNARSAPFDEALVNPVLGPDNRPRKLNWGDERPTNKTGLSSYFTKENSAANRLSKSLSYSVKSILKGSNKVFKLNRSKTMEEENTPVSKGAGLRMHKSVKNFAEGRNDAVNVNEVKSAGLAGKSEEKYSELKSSKSTSSMMRSSSASYFERDENAKMVSAASSKNLSSAANNDKSPNSKVSNINGNVIHLTVNNYLAPVNNLNANTQSSSSNGFSSTAGAGIEKDQKPKQALPPSQISRPSSSNPKYNAPLEEPTNKNEGVYESNKLMYSDSSYSNVNSLNAPEKSTLSTNQLKSAIEKKLSKEYKSQLSSSSSLNRPDLQSVMSKTPNSKSTTTDLKPKNVKEISKPTDLKVNYQVLLKNRETPPPRKRDEAKKIPESPLRKAASKSNISHSKNAGDSSLPYSSYLNSLFSTSFSHLNTVTPSGYTTNYNANNNDKKTPVSTKATPVTYNLTLSQKAQTLSRPQRTSSGQNNDKNYNSSSGLASSMTKPKLLYTVDPPSTTNLNSKYNNYMTQSKANPVRINYEKIDRPHSATPDRSVTPQAGLRRIGTPSTASGPNSASVNDHQRLSVPTKSNKHIKKDSGSTQDLLAKYRQRSSSPSQVYNPMLSNSSMALKSKAKY